MERGLLDALAEQKPLLPQEPDLPPELCHSILLEHHLQLRKYLNLHEIGPLLNKYNLLSALEQSFFSDPRYNIETKIDMLVDGLTKSSQRNYINVLVECLRESEESAGVAHAELADAIEKRYLEELNKYRGKVTPKRTCAIIIGKVIIAILTTLSFLFFIFIITLVVATSQTTEDIQIFSDGTLTLDSSQHRQWLHTIEISLTRFYGEDPSSGDKLKSCSAEAVLIKGKTCPSLMQSFTVVNVSSVMDTFFKYAYPGSIFNVTVTNVSNYHVWILRNWTEYRTLSEQRKTGIRQMQCEHYPKSCFNTKDYLNRVISYKVNTPGFHTYVLTNSSDLEPIAPFKFGFQLSYTIMGYNFSEFADNSDLVHIIFKNKPSKVTVNPKFDFSHYCSLVFFNCACGGAFNCFQLNFSDGTPRTDYLVLLLTLNIATLMPIIIYSSVYYFKYRGKKSKVLS